MKKVLFILLAAITVASCGKQKEPQKEAPKGGEELFLASTKNANDWSDYNTPSSANFKKRRPSVERDIPGVVNMNMLVRAFDSAGGRWHDAEVRINSVGAGYRVINVNSIHRSAITRNQFWAAGYWWLDYYRCTPYSQTLPNPPYSVLMPVAVEEEWFGSVTVMNESTCEETTAGEYVIAN